MNAQYGLQGALKIIGIKQFLGTSIKSKMILSNA